MKITIGDWIFEVTSLKGRKSKEFYAPFTAVTDITIADGELHIEGLLSLEKPTKKDFKTINELVKLLGYDYYVKSSIVNGERVIKKVPVQ